MFWATLAGRCECHVIHVAAAHNSLDWLPPSNTMLINSGRSVILSEGTELLLVMATVLLLVLGVFILVYSPKPIASPPCMCDVVKSVSSRQYDNIAVKTGLIP